jgi:uncharacterized membrane protein YesL
MNAMEMGGIMGGFYRISEWIMRFSVTNLLWIIFNIPVVFFAFNLLFVESVEQLIAVMLPIVVLAPFVLFPATAAMFSVVRKWIMGDTDVPLIKSFWRGYKSNYKQSMLGGLVIVPLWGIFVFDFIFYAMEVSSLLRYLFIVLGVILLAFTFNFFSMTVHFHMKFWAIMKNSALISIGRPLISVGMVLVNGMLLYISFTTFTWLLPFFTGSLAAYVSFLGFYHVYNKAQQIKEREEEKRKQEEERLALEQQGSVDEASASPDSSMNREDPSRTDANR